MALDAGWKGWMLGGQALLSLVIIFILVQPPDKNDTPELTEASTSSKGPAGKYQHYKGSLQGIYPKWAAGRQVRGYYPPDQTETPSTVDIRPTKHKKEKLPDCDKMKPGAKRMCCWDRRNSTARTEKMPNWYHATCAANGGKGTLRYQAAQNESLRGFDSTTANERTFKYPPHPDLPDVIDHSDAPLVLVVVAAGNRLRWLSEVPIPYVVMEDRAPSAEPYNVPVNRGFEASRFLKYIVDHYCTLPERIIFQHGHEWGLHQIAGRPFKLFSIVPFLKAFVAGGGVEVYDYTFLSQQIVDTQWWPLWDHHLRVWKSLGVLGWLGDWTKKFPRPGFPTPTQDPPTGPIRPYGCCATFVVNRKRIWSLPWEIWKAAYEFVLIDEPDHEGKATAWGMESAWSLLFGEPENDIIIPKLECMFAPWGDNHTEEFMLGQMNYKNRTHWWKKELEYFRVNFPPLWEEREMDKIPEEWEPRLKEDGCVTPCDHLAPP
eukprot:TRINITY_DN51861_c0_g1_i1.p1 TRINITY_DN51861_c0_g1~~TRINITY_DN51861_c0_g1_i1.p1  ORF type:complete len:488 (-),score=25.91 TRINITY_DN51861_c0_g1_i1:1251-2714(-)